MDDYKGKTTYEIIRTDIDDGKSSIMRELEAASVIYPEAVCRRLNGHARTNDFLQHYSFRVKPNVG